MSLEKNQILILLLSCAILPLGKCAEIGRVTIGYTPASNRTTPEVFSFSENARGQRNPLPVYLTLINESTGAPSGQYDNNVRVECEQQPSVEGYTRVQIAPVEVQTVGIPNADQPIPATLSVSLLQRGRAVSVRCWGTSEGPTPSPAENRTIQFSPERSISPPVLLEVRKAGTINFCSELIQVPITGSRTVTLELSETVVDSPVDITCSITNTTAGPMVLNITVPRVAIGQKQFAVPYGLLREGDPVLVQCRAASQSGTQFQYATSAGTPAMFVMGNGTVTLYPQLTTLSNTRMQALLVLDARPTTDVTFVCAAVVANSSEQALEIAKNPYCQFQERARPPQIQINTTVGNTPPPPTSSVITNTGAPPVVPSTGYNISGEWVVRNPTVIFRSDQAQIHQTVNLQRTSNPDMAVKELDKMLPNSSSQLYQMVLTCCAPPESNDSPKYTNSSAALLAVAELTPDRPINWTAATTPDQASTETPIRNPAFVEVAPCPCDLSTACDTDCCCDPDCSAGARDTFTCIPGIPGGNWSEIPQRDCTSQHFNKPDWFPFMCVEFERSAYLGLYWFPRNTIRQQTDYDRDVPAKRPAYSYRESQTRNVPEPGGTGYKEGTSVKTRMPTESAAGTFTLTLPQRSLGGECINQAPVRFLKDTEDTCTRSHIKDLCVGGSVLSARRYVEGSTVSHPPCPKSSVISPDGSAEGVAVSESHYLCATDLSGYYIQSTTVIEDLISPTGRSLFNVELLNNGTDCYFSNRTGAYMCSVTNSTVVTKDPPQRCWWDDGYERAPEPYFNNDTQTCENAVVDVLYNFTWDGAKISLLNATIVLGNISTTIERTVNRTITYTESIQIDSNTTMDVIRTNTSEVLLTYPTVLSQYFKVDFSHILLNYTRGENGTQESADSRGRYQRSGNLGYAFDLPVLSGVLVDQEEDPQNPVGNSSFHGYIDYNNTNRLQLWQPGAGRLCSSATTTRVNFGENAITSCMLRLSLSDLINCDTLRKLVLSQQDQLMKSSHISGSGDPSQFNTADWINIVREDISFIFGINTTEQENVSFNFTTAPTDVTTGVTEVTTATSTAGNQTKYIDVLSMVQGVCHNITSGIHVDVMYALVGLANGSPRYEIVGAHIRYTRSTWLMDCMGANARRCYSSSRDGATEQYVETFAISSSVNFIEVPAVTPEPRTKYQVEQDTDVCEQEACWSELAYPLQQGFRGDPFSYTLGFSLLAILGVVGVFMISKPWW